MITTLRERALARMTSRLRFPQLFGLLATLFVVDLVIPDLIPFVDEIMLFLLTALVGMLRERVPPIAAGPAAKPPERNVTPTGA